MIDRHLRHSRPTGTPRERPIIEHVASCPVCGNDDRRRFSMYYDGPLKLYKCRDCRFVADYPGPGADTAVRSYDDEADWLIPSLGDDWLYGGRERALDDIVRRIK